MNTKLTLIAALALAAAAPAMADTVEMKFTGTGQGKSIRITLDGDSSNVFAGQLRFDLKNGTGLAASLNGSQTLFCGDITEYVSSNYKVYSLVPASQINDTAAIGTAKANLLASLYDYVDGAQASNSVSDDFAAAFQIAVWEIITDYDAGIGLSSLNVTTGGFRAKKTDGSALWSAVANQVTDFFNHLNTSGSNDVTLMGLTNGTAQDQFVPFVSNVPTAGTASLTALGLVAMNSRRRRK